MLQNDQKNSNPFTKIDNVIALIVYIVTLIFLYTQKK